MTFFKEIKELKNDTVRHYLTEGKDYFAVSDENAKYLKIMEENRLVTLSKFSLDALFAYNLKQTKIIAVWVENGVLNLQVYPDKSFYIYKLNSENELLFNAIMGEDFLLVHTTKELNDSNQQSLLYYINLKEKIFSILNDDIIPASYHTPFICEVNDIEYIVAENSPIYPYELEDDNYNNDVLIVRADKILKATKNNEKIKWDVIASSKENYYLQIVNVYKDNICFSYTSKNLKETILCSYNLLTEQTRKEYSFTDIFDNFIFKSEEVKYAYKWNEFDKIIDIYDIKKGFFVKIDYSEFNNIYEDIELNTVLAILKKQYVVFDATDYERDEYAQIRVVYDIVTQKFLIYNSSLIVSQDIIY